MAGNIFDRMAEMRERGIESISLGTLKYVEGSIRVILQDFSDRPLEQIKGLSRLEGFLTATIESGATNLTVETTEVRLLLQRITNEIDMAEFRLGQAVRAGLGIRDERPMGLKQAEQQR